MPNSWGKDLPCQSWLSELKKHQKTKANQQVIPSKDFCNPKLFWAVHKAFLTSYPNFLKSINPGWIRTVEQPIVVHEMLGSSHSGDITTHEIIDPDQYGSPTFPSSPIGIAGGPLSCLDVKLYAHLSCKIHRETQRQGNMWFGSNEKSHRRKSWSLPNLILVPHLGENWHITSH